MTAPIFHIANAAEWADAQRSGRYERSTKGRSLADVGFVHCSFADQVAAVANAVYSHDDSDLVLLEIDPDAVVARVQVEDLDGEGTAYPHIYGPVPVTAVRAVHDLERDTGGAFRMPPTAEASER